MVFMQLTEEVRHQMQETLQKDYGVNLDNAWNRRVTDSWDKAQEQVRIYVDYRHHGCRKCNIQVTLNTVFQVHLDKMAKNL